jgi:predicted RNA-binding Zn ribbon-like protein
VAAAGQISMMVDPSGTLRTVAQASGLAGALARIILTVHRAQADGQWPRLKVCSNDSCRWAFWDSSRNRSGRWCTMSLCGNQAKVAAYRDRQ